MRLWRALCVASAAAVGAVAQLTPAEQTMLKAVVPTEIEAWLQNLTSTPHLAGTEDGEKVTMWYKQMLEEALAPIGRARVEIDTHEVLLSYYESASLDVYGEPATLREEAFPETDPTSDTEWNGRIWNGYGASGNVSGAEVVYANYGTPEDFVRLMDMRVDVKDRVVLVRYGQCFRGVKAFQAQMRGAAAVLIYSDPQQYGGPRFPNDVYPQSAFLPASGVQRGSVLNLPKCPGNPRGREDVCGVASEDELMPTIPVLPLSAEDATMIFATLGGPAAPGSWRGGLVGVNYTIGPGSSVDLVVNNTREVRQVHNVIATIPGSVPDEREDTPIVLGNHRDAWVFGAADPTSGSAAMLAVATGLAAAWEQADWRPNRTVILGSWDAEEYGIIGSTAWVEAHGNTLRNAAVYLNVDTAVSGNAAFGASASPAAAHAVVKAAADVDISPSITFDDVGPLGGGSDYAPFLNHLGIASVDFGYKFEGGYPVYHSVYDSFHWMKSFGDPTFANHAKVAQMWALLAMRFSSNRLLPLNLTTTGFRMTEWASDIAEQLDRAPIDGDMSAVLQAVADYRAEAVVFMSQLTGSPLNNTMLAQAERAFLSADGLPNRKWYRNVLMASGFGRGYGAETFPGLAQALADEDGAVFRAQAAVVARLVKDGCDTLRSGRPAVEPGKGGDDLATEPGFVVALCVGIPVFIALTVILAQKLSDPRRGSAPLGDGGASYGTAQSPVSRVTDDGTTTDL